MAQEAMLNLLAAKIRFDQSLQLRRAGEFQESTFDNVRATVLG